jgi:hypothetical protein
MQHTNTTARCIFCLLLIVRLLMLLFVKKSDYSVGSVQNRCVYWTGGY